MALSNMIGEIVASGTWLYDGLVPKRTYVLARDFDVQWELNNTEGWTEPGDGPAEPGPDGLYYYVSGTGPFASIAEAKAWAEEKWGPVRWDGRLKQMLVRLASLVGLKW
jgi:hypothetical protein